MNAVRFDDSFRDDIFDLVLIVCYVFWYRWCHLCGIHGVNVFAFCREKVAPASGWCTDIEGTNLWLGHVVCTLQHLGTSGDFAKFVVRSWHGFTRCICVRAWCRSVAFVSVCGQETSENARLIWVRIGLCKVSKYIRSSAAIRGISFDSIPTWYVSPSLITKSTCPRCCCWWLKNVSVWKVLLKSLGKAWTREIIFFSLSICVLVREWVNNDSRVSYGHVRISW